MPDLTKIVVRSDGWAGGPGFATFYSSSVGAALTAVHDFYFAARVYVPPPITFHFPGTGYTIHPADGVASGTWTSTAPSDVVGLGTGKYPAPAGACVVWRSSALNRHGHLSKGRTFLVPMAQDFYQNDGSIDDTALAVLRTAATNLVAATSFYVWERPSAVGATDGAEHLVSSATISDKASVLRSRRP